MASDGVARVVSTKVWVCTPTAVGADAPEPAVAGVAGSTAVAAARNASTPIRRSMPTRYELVRQG